MDIRAKLFMDANEIAKEEYLIKICKRENFEEITLLQALLFNMPQILLYNADWVDMILRI